MQTHGYASFTRPIVLIIAALLVITLFFAVRKHLRRRGEPMQEAGNISEEGGRHTPSISLPISGAMLLIFGFAYVDAQNWQFASRLFPEIVALVGLVLAAGAFVIDWRGLSALRTAGAGAGITHADGAFLKRSTVFLGWLIGVLLVTLVLGQYLALLLFVALYLAVWGRYSWKVIVPYTLACAVFLYVLFDVIVPVLWYESPWFSLFD